MPSLPSILESIPAAISWAQCSSSDALEDHAGDTHASEGVRDHQTPIQNSGAKGQLLLNDKLDVWYLEEEMRTLRVYQRESR